MRCYPSQLIKMPNSAEAGVKAAVSQEARMPPVLNADINALPGTPCRRSNYTPNSLSLRPNHTHIRAHKKIDGRGWQWSEHDENEVMMCKNWIELV